MYLFMDMITSAMFLLVTTLVMVYQREKTPETVRRVTKLILENMEKEEVCKQELLECLRADIRERANEKKS